jgi:hypothetical protein
MWSENMSLKATSKRDVHAECMQSRAPSSYLLRTEIYIYIYKTVYCCLVWV